jgi:hypothetical protein
MSGGEYKIGILSESVVSHHKSSRLRDNVSRQESSQLTRSRRYYREEVEGTTAVDGLSINIQLSTRIMPNIRCLSTTVLMSSKPIRILYHINSSEFGGFT